MNHPKSELGKWVELITQEIAQLNPGAFKAVGINKVIEEADSASRLAEILNQPTPLPQPPQTKEV